MSQLGYQWLLLDDCWADHQRDENDNLQPAPKQFPSGMKALVDYVHAKGLKLGLYTCVGEKTCKKNRPGSYGHYQQDADLFAEWGVDMVKADNCNKPVSYCFFIFLVYEEITFLSFFRFLLFSFSSGDV
jgi:alpha-galactosidase